MLKDTYLDEGHNQAFDDGNLVWELDDPLMSAVDCKTRVLKWMHEFTDERDYGTATREQALELVIRGAVGLMERGVTEDPFVAMWTSIVWYYG